MSRIAVVTDSTANLSKELVQQYYIHIAPLHITWDKIRYRDGVDIQPDEFYQRLRKPTTLPTTSGAIQGEFLQTFEELRGKVDGIVTMVLSVDLSAAYSSAMNAREMVSEMPIEVIDSRLSTIGMGFGVIAAAKVASGGGTIEQVAKAAKDIIAKVHILFALDTLANLLKVKPVLTIKNGLVEPVARPRTWYKATESLLKLMKEKVTDSPLHVAVMHADNPDGAGDLKREIASYFQCAELLVTGFTPVMGTHTGPNLLGIAFYNE